MPYLHLELSVGVNNPARSIQASRGGTMRRMDDELLRYRSQFPILGRTTYLISNSLGAMPQGVYDAP